MTATFVVDSRTLTVAKQADDPGANGVVTSSPAGIDCGADCVEVLQIGTSVTLTATPAAGQASYAAGPAHRSAAPQPPVSSRSTETGTSLRASAARSVTWP